MNTTIHGWGAASLPINVYADFVTTPQYRIPDAHTRFFFTQEHKKKNLLPPKTEYTASAPGTIRASQEHSGPGFAVAACSRYVTQKNRQGAWAVLSGKSGGLLPPAISPAFNDDKQCCARRATLE